VEAEQRLLAFVQTFLRRLLCTETQAWQMRLLLREVIEPTRAGEELVQEGFQPFFEVLLDILRRLTPKTLPPSRLHQLGFSIIAQCVFYRFHHRIVELMIPEEERATAFQVEALADHVYGFSRAALRSLAAEATDAAGADWPTKNQLLDDSQEHSSCRQTGG
jgi:hypothetical protein